MQNGFLIASLRTKNNISQADFADMLDIGLSTYKLYEAGVRPMKLREANLICNLFNISLDYLLNLSNNSFTDNFRKEIDYRYLRFCIKHLRKKDKKTQKEFAHEFNVASTTISRYENKPFYISLSFLYDIAKKYNISIDYLCGKSLKKEIL